MAMTLMILHGLNLTEHLLNVVETGMCIMGVQPTLWIHLSEQLKIRIRIMLLLIDQPIVSHASMLCALSAQTHLTGLPGNRHPLTPTSSSSSFLLRVLMYAGSGPVYHRSTRLDERTRRVISGTTTLIHSPID